MAGKMKNGTAKVAGKTKAGTAEKTVNIAFIGYGIQGRTVLVPNIIKQKNVVVKAVCDCDRVRREAGTKFVNDYYKKNRKPQLAKCKAVADFRDIIKDKEINAVCIATPDHWHAYISCAAMKAGKDVYCEKPLTYSVEEAMLVMKAQKKFKRVFQTGAMQRSWREFRTACMIVRNGCIGKIKYVDCNYGNASAQNNTDIADFPANLGGPSHPHRFFCQWNGEEKKFQDIPTESAPNSDVDWDMWLGPAPWSPYSDQCAPRKVANFYPMFWRFDDNYGTGYNGDWGAHHLDIAQWGLNMDGKGPKYVRPYTAQNPSNIHDKRSLYYEYENGTKVFYGHPTEHLKKLGANNLSPMVTFIGTEGTACASRGGFFWASSPSLMNVKLPEGQESAYMNGFGNHNRNFIESILTGRPTICPVEAGVSSSNMCIMGTIAHRLGRMLEWDWKNSTFVNDPEAVSLMWRENRGEWAKVF